MRLRSLLARHPVASYVTLTLALSWGAALIVVGGPGAFPASTSEVKRLLPITVAVMLLGPSCVGVFMTWAVRGSTGLRELFGSLLRWRADARWYAVALVTTPLLAGGVLLALTPISSHFLPGITVTDQRFTLILIAIAVGLAAGLFEEPGWTGFATPMLRRRHGVMATGLLVGLVWGAWHLIGAAWGSGDDEGAFSPTLFLAQALFYMTVLPAYRVMMVWVHDRTKSLLIAVLMHASLTGNVLFILMPPVTSAASLLTWYLAIAAVFWAAVGGVALASRSGAGHRSAERSVT